MVQEAMHLARSLDGLVNTFCQLRFSLIMYRKSIEDQWRTSSNTETDADIA